MAQKEKIVLATSQQVIATGLVNIIEQMEGVELSGIASTKPQLLELLVVHQPSMLMIDRWFDDMFLESNWEKPIA